MPGALHSHFESSRECSCRSALHFTQPHIISCLSSRSSTARVLGTYAAFESQSFRLITVTVPASLCACSSLVQSRVCQDALHQCPPLLLRSTSARGGRRASDSEESQRLRGHHLRLSTHHLRLSTPNRSAGYHAGILCHQPRAYRRGSVAITSRLSLRLHPPRAYRRGHNTAYLDAYPLRTAVSANMPTSSRINAASCLSPRPPISTPSTTPASSFGSSPTYIHAAMGDAAAVLRPTPRETPSSPHALEPPTRPMQHQIERCSAPRLVERSTTPRSPHVLEPYAAAAIGPIERMMLNSMRLLGMLLGTRLSARGVTPSPAASAEKHYRMMLRLEPLMRHLRRSSNRTD